jgi:rhodanese-related sulfurtransferase
MMKSTRWVLAILFVFILPTAAVLLTLPGCSGTATPLTTMSTPFTQTTSLASPTTTPTTAAARKNVSVTEASALIDANKDNQDFVILDVRTPGEYAAGHIETSRNVDYEAADFRDQVNKLDKGKTYLVYCSTGVRSAGASDIMVGLGFTDVYNMTGGITDWQAAGLPVVQ